MGRSAKRLHASREVKDLSKMTVHELMTEANQLMQEGMVAIGRIEKNIEELQRMFVTQLPFTRRLAKRAPQRKR